jgi:ATP-binding cassette subfamily E protein 1
VAICLCLSQEADLYLLDEPSAYLDVEQRLLISKLLKDLMEERGKTALVVDHDLLFIDYISDELMVFDGEPSESGESKGPFSMVEGMNIFLKDLGMTFRRDPESQRPRANKPGSVKDREQISENKLYYV